MGNAASSPPSPPSPPGAGPSSSCSSPPPPPGAGPSTSSPPPLPGAVPSSSSSPPPPPPPAALPEELVEEILLRFPPGEPASLVRAALVCKQWCRLISDARFCRRFHELHRTPLMLGFLCNTSYEGSRFVPTTAFCPPGTRRFDWEALDAHHGRVLGLRYVPQTEGVLVVWDPITDEQWELPVPPRFTLGWAAAVLCAGTLTGACNHLDCHGEPFLVVFVGCDPHEMFVYTYSSDVKAWSEPISTEHPDPINCDFVGLGRHPVLVGKALYFGIRCTNLNLKYNLESCEMSFIQLPSTYEWSYPHHCMLTTMDKGVLGLITVDYSKLVYELRIWLMKDTTAVDAGWTQSRVIDLRTTVLPHDGFFTSPRVGVTDRLGTLLHDGFFTSPRVGVTDGLGILLQDGFFTSPNVVGVTDGLGTLFMMVESVLYTIDLKTCMVELYQYQHRGIKYIIPYMRLYTPELEAACAGEGPSEGGSGRGPGAIVTG